MQNISVVICTHNPREDYLRRTLDALKIQTLPKEQWELLLIDNASHRPLSNLWDLSWHPNARSTREEKLGLTAARLRGIEESVGEVLLFVDDDNVLNPDYCEVLLRLAMRFPQIGCFGAGAVEPEFEVAPHADIKPHLGSLALRSVDRTIWSNDPMDAITPWGAGLAVRRLVAESYFHSVGNSQIRQTLGRSGGSLNSGEDDEFSWVACEIGYGKGLFPELKLLHLIPAQRIQMGYLARLAEGQFFSAALLAVIHGKPLPQTDCPGLDKVVKAFLQAKPFQFLREVSRWLESCRWNKFDLRIRRARAAGVKRACETVRQLDLDQVSWQEPCPREAPRPLSGTAPWSADPTLLCNLPAAEPQSLARQQARSRTVAHISLSTLPVNGHPTLNDVTNDVSLSVIICTRNRAESLQQTLNALSKVRVRMGCRAELIVVDNASTDSTADVVRNAALSNMKIVYLFEPKRGKSHALNSGLAMASGQILLFTDDDVVPSEEWIEQMLVCFDTTQCDAVVGKVKLAPHLERTWMNGLERAYLAVIDFESDRTLHWVGANAAFHRRCLERVSAFDPELGSGALGNAEDTLFGYQLVEAGFKLEYAANAVVVHQPDVSRLNRRAWLDAARQRGHSQAYLLHHWEHAKIRAAGLKRLWYHMKLKLRRMLQPPPMDSEWCPRWELSYVHDLALCHQYCIERRRPSNYARRGLAKLYARPAPQPSSSPISSPLISGNAPEHKVRAG